MILSLGERIWVYENNTEEPEYQLLRLALYFQTTNPY